MKNLKQIAMMLSIWTLVVVTGSTQDLAAFKVPDSSRAFVFNLRMPPENAASDRSTNATPWGIEGLQTIMAKGFKTTRRTGGVTITFVDALVCHVHRIKEGKSGNSVMLVGELSVSYPGGTSVLVLGRSMRLVDLSENTFVPSTTFSDVYEGEAAIKKLKEIGLEPPEDMDWQKATNRESSQPQHPADGRQPSRDKPNSTPAAAGSRR
jgi:hypothetical protein